MVKPEAVKPEAGGPVHGKALLRGPAREEGFGGCSAPVSNPGFPRRVYRRRAPRRDQWQARILAGVMSRATVHLHSGLPEEAVRRCHMTPVGDVGAFVRAWRDRNPRGRIAVLPEGPQTIPYPDSGQKAKG